MSRSYWELYFGMLRDDKNKHMKPALKRATREKLREEWGDDPLESPLTEQPRFRSTETNMTYYGIDTHLSELTDAELSRMFRQQEIHSITSRLQTAWLRWRRTPAGIVFIHVMTMNV